MAPADTENLSVLNYLTAVSSMRARLGDPLPPEFIYTGMEDLVLKHGRPFTPQPLPKGYKRGTPKHCFDNAYKLVLRRKGLRYVEGYAMHIIPVHHAWAIDAQDRVIDVTWETPGTEYFGVVISTERVRSIRKKEHCSVLDDWPNHFKILREPFTEAQ